MPQTNRKLLEGADRKTLMAILKEAPVAEEPENPSTPEGESAADNAKGDKVFEGDFYTLLQDDIGHYIIVRLADGASGYFQGEDASAIEQEYNALIDKFEDDAAFTRAFDYWAQQYDEILEIDNGADQQG